MARGSNAVAPPLKIAPELKSKELATKLVRKQESMMTRPPSLPHQQWDPLSSGVQEPPLNGARDPMSKLMGPPKLDSCIASSSLPSLAYVHPP